MNEALQAPMTIIRRKQLEERTGLPRSSIYAKLDPTSEQHDPDFPRPIRLGSRAVGWLSSSVDIWIANQIEKSRSAALDKQRCKTDPVSLAEQA